MSKKTKYVIPDLEFDEDNHAKITTHKGNVYTVKKLSDGEFLAAMSSGGEKRSDLSMIAVVSAALVEPTMTRQQVSNNLFDGELMVLFTAISNYHSSALDFLESMEQKTDY